MILRVFLAVLFLSVCTTSLLLYFQSYYFTLLSFSLLLQRVRLPRTTWTFGFYWGSDGTFLWYCVITTLVPTVTTVIGVRWWSPHQKVLRNFLWGREPHSNSRSSCGRGCLCIHGLSSGGGTANNIPIKTATHIDSHGRYGGGDTIETIPSLSVTKCRSLWQESHHSGR